MYMVFYFYTAEAIHCPHLPLIWKTHNGSLYPDDIQHRATGGPQLAMAWPKLHVIRRPIVEDMH